MSTMTNVELGKIPEGYKLTEVGVIPSSWDVTALSSQLKESPKYGINAAAVELTGNLPVYLRITDISEDGYFKPSIKVGVDNPFSSLYKMDSGDLVVARTGASVGKSYLYRPEDGELIYAGFLIKLIPDQNKLKSDYLFQYLRSESYWAWVVVMSMRSGQPGINGVEYGQLPIPLPSPKEQTAIANALSDVDNLIASLETLITKKSAIKTAAMQQLLTGKKRLPQFAKKGEKQGAKQGSDHTVGSCSISKASQIKNTDQTAPRPGYKQTELGEIPEDWDVIEFGNLVDYVKGYPFKSSEYTSDGARVIRVSDTTFDSIKDDGCVYVSADSVKKYKKWQLRENDLIFSTVGSKPPMYDSLVGKAVIVTAAHDGSLLNQNAVIIRSKVKSGSFQKLLLNHFRMERYIDHVEIIYRGNANQASITLENLFEFKLPLPSSEEEQIAIANFLSDMDTELDALEQRLSKTQKIKQGMMQELLTGKTRLV